MHTRASLRSWDGWVCSAPRRRPRDAPTAPRAAAARAPRGAAGPHHSVGAGGIGSSATTIRPWSASRSSASSWSRGFIVVNVLNDGPDAVTIAQVQVDEAFWTYTADDGVPDSGVALGHLGRTTLRIPYPWVDGDAHLLKVLTSTGTAFEHEIPVAVETPTPGARFFGVFTLIGLYVGVIPVMIGLLWFPFLKRLSVRGTDFLLRIDGWITPRSCSLTGASEGLRVGGAAARVVSGRRAVRAGGREVPTCCSKASARGSGRGAETQMRRAGRLGAGSADRGRNRPPQFRRGPRDRVGVCAW